MSLCNQQCQSSCRAEHGRNERRWNTTTSDLNPSSRQVSNWNLSIIPILIFVLPRLTLLITLVLILIFLFFPEGMF